jgi:lipid-A-disaccharide synthase-like uncharacterized protein
VLSAPVPGQVPVVVVLLGIVGGAIFYGRFYVQWIVSEMRRRSVVPVAFWYMSVAGSVLLLVHNVLIVSPGATFGQSFNMVVYTRNLVHLWRERGKLSRGLYVVAHLFAGLVVGAGVIFTAYTWFREFEHNQTLTDAEAARNWLWLGVWGAGQALFFARFLVQWLMTEYKRRCVIPPAFWYLSLLAAVLQSASFVQRGDWVNAVGMAATLLIYARNIWLIRAYRELESGG